MRIVAFDLHAGAVPLQHHAIEKNHNRVVLTKGVESGLVYAFLNIVGNNKVQHLAMKHVVDVKHHLGQQPIVGLIFRRVYEIRPGVCLDRERQEVPVGRMNEEVG